MPTLNFVWIGPPRFNEGGGDVIGPCLLDQNFKTHHATKLTINPMAFWCQELYKSAYEAFFHKEGVAIQVRSVEEALEMSEAPQIADVKSYYHYLTATVPPLTLHCVYAKDLLFNVILATEGGYVLDSTIYPQSTDKPVHFPHQERFRLPLIMAAEYLEPDCFMQYAPPADLSRANACLSLYLKLFDALLFNPKKRDVLGRFWTIYELETIGRIAIHALQLKPYERLKITGPVLSPDEYRYDDCDGWVGQADDYWIQFKACGVVKEFRNTYKAKPISVEHRHVEKYQITQLKFYLEHGGDVNVCSNDSYRSSDGLYVIENPSLLALALKVFDASNPLSRDCIALLLKHGADPRRTCCYLRYIDGKLEAPSALRLTNLITLSEDPLQDFRKRPDSRPFCLH